MLNFKKDTFTQALRLTQKQPWLEKKVETLAFMLADECDADDQRELLIELLDRFFISQQVNFKKN